VSLQRTDDWYAARLGKVTASRIADVVAKTRNGWGASRKNYQAELVAERLTGKPASRYTSPAMLHGIETEPDAIAAFEFYHDIETQECGFIEHPSIAMSGASPDRLIGDDGLLEVKCPNTATHLDTLLGAPVENRYILQMQWQLACTGRDYCIWASFDPRLPESMQLYTVRVDRDDALIADLEREVKLFLGEVNTIVSELQARYEEAA
jgi:putative phage-type endonuclease